jgi:hypothetical protein
VSWALGGCALDLVTITLTVTKFLKNKKRSSTKEETHITFDEYLP